MERMLTKIARVDRLLSSSDPRNNHTVLTTLTVEYEESTQCHQEIIIIF